MLLDTYFSTWYVHTMHDNSCKFYGASWPHTHASLSQGNHEAPTASVLQRGGKLVEAKEADEWQHCVKANAQFVVEKMSE